MISRKTAAELMFHHETLREPSPSLEKILKDIPDGLTAKDKAYWSKHYPGLSYTKGANIIRAELRRRARLLKASSLLGV